MDNGFTRDTSPNLFSSPSLGSEYRGAHQAAIPSSKNVFPARDSRYPAHAAALNDGRLVTDYRPQCSKNIRVGQ